LTQTVTTSTSGAAISAAALSKARDTPNSAAARRLDSGEELAMPIRRNASGCAASAARWTGPQPWPDLSPINPTP